MEFVPILTAEKIFLTGYIVVFMAALRYAVLAMNPKSVAIAFLGFPFIYNWSMHMGFYSFIYSLAAFLIYIGHWVKHRNEISLCRRMFPLTAISCLLYLTHMLSLFMAVAVVGIMTAWLVALGSSDERASSIKHTDVPRRDMWRGLKLGMIPMLSFVPTFVLVGLFVYDKPSVAGSLIGPVKVVLRHFLSFQKVEAVVFVGFAILVLLLLFAIRRKFYRFRFDRWDGLLLAVVFCSFLYAVVPNDILGGSHVRPRLVLYPMLLLILWLGSQTYSDLVNRAVAGGASVLAIIGIIINLNQYKNFNENLAEYQSAIHFIEPQSNLLPISFTHWTSAGFDWFRRTAPDPFLHASGYLAVAKQLIDLGNYEAATEHFPTAFRPGLDPYVYIGNRDDPYSRLNIEGYSRTGQHVDYVVVWSALGVERDLAQTTNLRRQLNDGYQLLCTSRAGLMQVYRRTTYEGASRIIATSQK
jgi:hypothetical protein